MAKTSKSIHKLTDSSPIRASASRRKAFSLLITIVILGLVGWVFLGQASKAAEMERQIREMRQQKAELQRQNEHLIYLIAQRASVRQLEQRAVQLGYEPVRRARFLAVAGYSTRGGSASDRAGGSSEDAGTSTAVGWWRTVTDQFEAWSHSETP